MRYLRGQNRLPKAFHVRYSLSSTTGYVSRKSFTSFSTFDNTFSNANSGVCTPIMTSPSSSYFSYHVRKYGSVRWQLMHEYVQMSMSTGFFPLNSPIVIGAACPELSRGGLIYPSGSTNSGAFGYISAFASGVSASTASEGRTPDIFSSSPRS